MLCTDSQMQMLFVPSYTGLVRTISSVRNGAEFGHS